MIAVSMLAIFIVLGTIVTAINIYNYNRIVRDSDNILAVLQENDGAFPEDMRPMRHMEDLSEHKDQNLSSEISRCKKASLRKRASSPDTSA